MFTATNWTGPKQASMQSAPWRMETHPPSRKAQLPGLPRWPHASPLLRSCIQHSTAHLSTLADGAAGSGQGVCEWGTQEGSRLCVREEANRANSQEDEERVQIPNLQNQTTGRTGERVMGEGGRWWEAGQVAEVVLHLQSSVLYLALVGWSPERSYRNHPPHLTQHSLNQAKRAFSSVMGANWSSIGMGVMGSTNHTVHWGLCSSSRQGLGAHFI